MTVAQLIFACGQTISIFWSCVWELREGRPGRGYGHRSRGVGGLGGPWVPLFLAQAHKQGQHWFQNLGGTKWHGLWHHRPKHWSSATSHPLGVSILGLLNTLFKCLHFYLCDFSFSYRWLTKITGRADLLQKMADTGSANVEIYVFRMGKTGLRSWPYIYPERLVNSSRFFQKLEILPTSLCSGTPPVTHDKRY